MNSYRKFLKLDVTGKSPAFLLKKNKNYLPKKAINNLFEVSKNLSQDSRICLHSSKKDKVQFMINVLKPREKYYYNFHPRVDEYYFILEGKLLIKYFKKNILKKIVLDKKNFPLFKMNKKVKHVTIPLTKKCMFLEIREGPFNSRKDSIFLKKYEKNL